MTTIPLFFVVGFGVFNSVLLVMMCVAISVQRNEEHETRVAWARSHGEKTSAVTSKERC